MKYTLIIAVLAYTLAFTNAYKIFQSRIPNDKLVTDPCDGSIWERVGHENKDGGGVRNPYGKAFAAEGKVWTRKDQDQEDADGDGLTNGYDLGDPDCKWKPGSTPKRTTDITHPGICEPLDDPKCRGQFLNCNRKKFHCPAINSPDVKSINLTLPANTTVPGKETTYICTSLLVNLPADQLYDVIASKPLIDNRYVMHHMVAMGCEGKLPPEEVGRVYDCAMFDNRCNKVLDIWTFDMDGFCQPDYKAKRFGKGLNNSGVQLFYTPKLRQYSEDVFLTGDLGIFIPPNTKRHVVDGICDEESSKKEFEKPFNISALLFHMHYKGNRMWAKQYRNGTLLRTFADQQPYSYDSPVFYTYDDPIEVLPGKFRRALVGTPPNDGRPHGLTMQRNAFQDEMCFVIFSYFPADEFKVSSCYTLGMKTTTDKDLYPNCDWKKVSSRFLVDSQYIRDICDVASKRNCTPKCYQYTEKFVEDYPSCFPKDGLIRGDFAREIPLGFPSV